MKDSIFIHIPKTGGNTIERVFNLKDFRDEGRNVKIPHRSGMITCKHGEYSYLMKRRLISQEFSDGAFKFAFVRNPYDRAVSHWAFAKDKYKHMGELDRDTTFLYFVRKVIPKYANFRVQCYWLDHLPCDFLGRMETFSDDLIYVAEQVGVKLKADAIPFANVSQRPRDYTKVYCEESKRLVEEFYAEDFKKLGYKYEE